MALRFFKKKTPQTVINNMNKSYIEETSIKEEEIKTTEGKVKNNKTKKKDDMNTEMKDKIKQAEVALNEMAPEVKVVKKDKSLIERTESSKIVLTEDNRQLLID